MIVTYDTETQGRELSESEIRQLKDLDTKCVSFSDDEPELTEELINRMRQSCCITGKNTK